MPKLGHATTALWARLNLSLGDGPFPTFDDGDASGEYTRVGYEVHTVSADARSFVPFGDADFGEGTEVFASFIADAAPDDTGYGIVCHVQDNDNFYALGVGNDGTYAIQKVEHGEATVLTGGGQWVDSPTREAGLQGGSLSATCGGSELSLYDNDELVDRVTDETFTRGGVGVFVETFEHGDAAVLVNGFDVAGVTKRGTLDNDILDEWFRWVADTPTDITNCRLGDPSGVLAPRPRFVTECVGAITYVQLKNGFQADTLFEDLVERSGRRLRERHGFPDCVRDRAVRGTLGGAAGGDVACIEIKGTRFVLWWNDGGVVGVFRPEADTIPMPRKDEWTAEWWGFAAGLPR